MENVSVKRTHISTGSTPSKPQKKRTRTALSPAIRKSLFARQNVSDIVSPENSSVKSPKHKITKNILAKAKCHIVSPLRKSPVKRHKWTFEEEKALVCHRHCKD